MNLGHASEYFFAFVQHVAYFGGHAHDYAKIDDFMRTFSSDSHVTAQYRLHIVIGRVTCPHRS